MEIKPFSFVAPASRMPESAERSCASFIHNLAKPAGSCDPRLCTHLLGRSAGPCFPKHKSNLFCCLKLSSRKPRFATHDWAASRFPSLASVILQLTRLLNPYSRWSHAPRHFFSCSNIFENFVWFSAMVQSSA